MKIIEYQVVIETIFAIAVVVREAMKEGWQPLGGPFKTPYKDIEVGQAMVKYEEEDYDMGGEE